MKKNSVTLILLSLALAFVTSCVEDIDKSNRYTFVDDTVASYLEKHQDVYGDFIYILKRGGKFSLMKAYGTYTCFAPTNDAVRRFLVEQDSIYQHSLGTPKVIDTGIHSPELTDLSDSMCVVIAQTHILPAAFLTTEMEGSVIPTMNLNDRYLTLSYGVDSLAHSQLFVNGAEIVVGDQEVENGIVQTISAVLNPSSSTISAQIENMKFLSIFSEALERTGIADQLQDYKDYSYTQGDMKTITIYGNSGCPYPANRYFGFTAFVEPDSVFEAAGIYSIEQLQERCLDWYPEATDPDYTSENNALHKFVAYHLLNRKVLYANLTCYKIVCGDYYKSENNYTKLADRIEYFETLQHSLIKVCRPLSNSAYSDVVLLNYCRDLTDREKPFDIKAGSKQINVNIKVLDPSDAKADASRYPSYDPEALNGCIHLIDHILVYDDDVMSGFVLNETMRFDFSALVPEFTNNNIRWCDGKRVQFAASSGDYEFYIPHSYSDYLQYFTEETRLYYLSPHTSWADYQGDEMMALGGFDFAYRMPPVPEGTYEIRMGYSANSHRHIVQFYIDNEVTGIPVDLRKLGTDPIINWKSDNVTDDDGVANDKEMKNRGYLKGPTIFYYNGSTLARNYSGDLRKVVTTKFLGKGDHYIRFKNVMENDDGSAQFMHDYLEIVPVGYLRREDISENEKRK